MIARTSSNEDFIELRDKALISKMWDLFAEYYITLNIESLHCQFIR